jgi:RHS repeat-associated protein
MNLNTLLKSIFALVLLAMLPSMTTAATETIIWIHTDHLGSPIAGRNAAGETTWEQAYAPWGERQPVAGVPQAPAGVGYTGHVYDEQVGLIYAGARWYDPAMGRFISPDAVRFGAVNIHLFNRYAYANHNPYLFVDPDGNESREAAWAALGDEDPGRAMAQGARSVAEGASAVGDAIEPDWLSAIPLVGPLIKGIKVADDTRKLATPIYKTTKEAKAAAEKIGFRKIKETVHDGQAVFQRGKNEFITRDIDGHNGGAWKMADSVANLGKKETRSGTFDVNLKRIGD